LEFVNESDIKFIRLNFCDIFGMQKNISIMSEELKSAFKTGVSFDAHSIKGFDGTHSDLVLVPDPATISLLPWRPGSVARFYCELKNSDGTDFLFDTRTLLKKSAARAAAMGYTCKIGTECEFYLFKTDENGEPTNILFDKGGYLDIAPLDRGEDIRREICLTLEEMGVKPEASYHEEGPGQNEIDFMSSDALTAADNFQTFKTVVKAIATRNGLHASFMPKPILDAPGSGMHVNLSLFKNGNNIFSKNEEHSDVAESFIAGIFNKVPEITAFLNPLDNSYERLGKVGAPKYVSWSHLNYAQMVRIPAAVNEKVRMELRSPDPSLNPYLAFSLLIEAGLNGIENNMVLPPTVDEELFSADESIVKSLGMLPISLAKAIELAENSDFIKNVLGDELLNKYLELKKTEIADKNYDIKEKFYRDKYFNIV